MTASHRWTIQRSVIGRSVKLRTTTLRMGSRGRLHGSNLTGWGSTLMANGIIHTQSRKQDGQYVNHFHTFRHHRTGVLVWGLVLPAYLPPIAGSVLAFVFDWRLTGVAELI